MNTRVLLFLTACILILTSCADNAPYTVECASCHVYGFWGGLWHGMIAAFDFIGMLIWDDVVVYAPNNNGGWYAFGFVLGVGGFSLGLSKGSSRRRAKG